MALGITTLVVLFLLIVKLRDEGAAARLAAGNQPASEPSSAAAIARLPPPTGPTDEDEEESEAAKEDFQAITDGTIGLDQVEMFAYNRLVSWVKSQSFARLWARARKNPAYTYLYDDAAGQRGRWWPWTWKSARPATRERPKPACSSTRHRRPRSNPAAICTSCSSSIFP